jgi:DNA/RNA-binding domain of Phe-tRNA-synthetase-like protein
LRPWLLKGKAQKDFVRHSSKLNYVLQISPDLTIAFPGLRVVEIEIGNLKIKKSDPQLEEFKSKKQTEIRGRIKSLEEVKNLPIFRAYRDFYWKVGIDPTKTRPAGEALTRRILAGKDLPTINTLVDSYNIASAESFVAIAAFDLSVVSRDSLVMRRASEGEAFLGIGMSSQIKLSGIEIVIEDQAKRDLIAVYPYRDSDSSKVTESTKDVLLMSCGVPGIPDEALNAAASLTREYVERYCLSVLT